MNSWPIVVIALIYFAWNIIVLGTTAYVVFWLGHSGWWFLFALICCGSFSEAAVRIQGRPTSEEAC